MPVTTALMIATIKLAPAFEALRLLFAVLTQASVDSPGPLLGIGAIIRLSHLVAYAQ